MPRTPPQAGAWECGTRLVVREDGTHVAAIALAGQRGWIIMRNGGDIRTLRVGALRKWHAGDHLWEGPDEPLPIPEALRLVVEYLEAKPDLVADASLAARMTARQKAGMLVRTHGTERALQACLAMPAGWGARAVAGELRAALRVDGGAVDNGDPR